MAHEEPAPPADAAGAAQASGPKSKLPLMAAIAVGIAVGAGSGVFVAGPMFARKFAAQIAPATADAETPAEGGEAKKAEEAPAEHDGAKTAAAVAPPVLLLENLVLNPSGSGGSRYLLMSIGIECKDQKGVEALSVREPELRDLILGALGRKSVEELSDVTLRDAIKNEIVGVISERFGKSLVKQIYFSQFVMQ